VFLRSKAIVDYIIDLLIYIAYLKANLVTSIISVKEEYLNSKPLITRKLRFLLLRNRDW
jgi:hypothetical protein